jgi:hypothetical protein
MQTYGGMEIQFYAPAALPSGKEPLFPLNIGWVGPRTGLDAVMKT